MKFLNIYLNPIRKILTFCFNVYSRSIILFYLKIETNINSVGFLNKPYFYIKL